MLRKICASVRLFDASDKPAVRRRSTIGMFTAPDDPRTLDYIHGRFG